MLLGTVPAFSRVAAPLSSTRVSGAALLELAGHDGKAVATSGVAKCL